MWVCGCIGVRHWLRHWIRASLLIPELSSSSAVTPYHLQVHCGSSLHRCITDRQSLKLFLMIRVAYAASAKTVPLPSSASLQTNPDHHRLLLLPAQLMIWWLWHHSDVSCREWAFPEWNASEHWSQRVTIWIGQPSYSLRGTVLFPETNRHALVVLLLRSALLLLVFNKNRLLFLSDLRSGRFQLQRKEESKTRITTWWECLQGEGTTHNTKENISLILSDTLVEGTRLHSLQLEINVIIDCNLSSSRVIVIDVASQLEQSSYNSCTIDEYTKHIVHTEHHEE